MVSAVTINCSIDCITQCCSADDRHVADNNVVTQLQKSVADLLAGFQQFSSHVETKLASVHSKVVVLEKSSTEVERKLAMLVTVMNCSQQDAQLRDVVAQPAGSVLGNTKNVHEGRANLNHLQDQMEEINATVQTNIEAIAAFSGRLNAHKENVQKRSTVNERAAIHSDSVDELATQVEELGNNLTSKLEALEAQTVHSTGCVQYLPTSCQEIAERWPNSFSGHYQILSGNDTITVYCYITSPPKPAPSCEAMMSLNLTIPAGEYWVTVENGSSQRVFCPSQSQPVLSCKNLFEMNPLTPAGAYWTLRNYTTGAVHKEFCTSYEHPADSCDTILKSHPTIPSKYYWVANESEPIGKYCLRNDEEHPGESCDSILKLSSTIRPDLYWVGEGDGVHAVFCDDEERTAPSCESILKHLDIIPVEKKFLPHWVSIGNSAVQVICTSESRRWPETCDELLLRNSTAGLYWIKDSKDQVYCTSANKPAPSCESILEVFNTNFSLTHWIEDGNSSSEVVCTSESNRWPGTCYDLLENCSSGVRAGLYWLTDRDTQVYCTSECKRAPSCDQVLNVSHAGLYWINGYGSQVYCTSANRRAPSCDQVLNVSHAGLYWINGYGSQVYCTSANRRAPSCGQVLNVSHAGLYWISGYGSQVYCTSANKPADSCESILEVFNRNFSLAHWIKDGNSSSEVVCTSESNRWPGTCYDLLENCSSGVKAGLYWLTDSDTQVYCTSECKPASSCDQVFEASDTVPAGLYWISTENINMQGLYGENCTSHNRTAVQFYCSSRAHPAPSCEAVFDYSCPTNPPGLYWISTLSGSPESVYCTPHNQCCNSTGGWMRAKYLNMSDPTQPCPNGFTARIDHNKRTCVKPNDTGCTPINIHTHGVEYNKICGKLIAYQIGTTKAFKYVDDNIIVTSNDSYVDGVSITHGPEHSRTHIWTFAAAADELFADSWTCPCSVTDTKFTGRLPDFIENDYFCDTAGYNGTRGYTFYHKNPLWDGAGCGPDSSCCTFNSPPWFCKHLPQPTTDDIEIRVCTTRSECDTALEMIELYIQ